MRVTLQSRMMTSLRLVICCQVGHTHKEAGDKKGDGHWVVVALQEGPSGTQLRAQFAGREPSVSWIHLL